MDSIPVIGKEYSFYDDGKITESRRSLAVVNRVITKEEAMDIYFTLNDYDIECTYDIDLYTLWKDAIDEHRQADNFTVIGKGIDVTPGAPWLYAEDTDYFVECIIPEYDKNPIWFARTVTGGWFSINIQSSWQTGELDVDQKYNLSKNEFVADRVLN